MPFKVECGVESYRIVGPNGEEGELYEWGQTAFLQIGNSVYYCVGEPDDDDQPVMRVKNFEAMDSEVEYVHFEGEPEEDEPDEEDDDDSESPGPELVA